MQAQALRWGGTHERGRAADGWAGAAAYVAAGLLGYLTLVNQDRDAPCGTK